MTRLVAAASPVLPAGCGVRERNELTSGSAGVRVAAAAIDPSAEGWVRQDLAGAQTLGGDADQATEVLSGGPSQDKVSTRRAEYAVLRVTAK